MQNITRSNLIRLRVAKVKKEWEKQHPLGKYEHFADFSWGRESKAGLEKKAHQEL